MSEVKVRFERVNFNKTVKYVRENLIDEVDEEYRPFVDDYLKNEVKRLIIGEMEIWGKKDFCYFQNLVHHPIQGVACMYIVGDEPKEEESSFRIEIVNKEFDGNVVACLYTYLV